MPRRVRGPGESRTSSVAMCRWCLLGTVFLTLVINVWLRRDAIAPRAPTLRPAGGPAPAQRPGGFAPDPYGRPLMVHGTDVPRRQPPGQQPPLTPPGQQFRPGMPARPAAPAADTSHLRGAPAAPVPLQPPLAPGGSPYVPPAGAAAPPAAPGVSPTTPAVPPGVAPAPAAAAPAPQVPAPTPATALPPPPAAVRPADTHSAGTQAVVAAASPAGPPPRPPPGPVPSPVTPPPGTRLPDTPLLKDQAFKDALHKVAVDATVVISVGNEGFLPMLTNFYISSIEKWGITNFLTVGLTPGMCAKMPAGAACYEMKGVPSAKGGSYGSSGFARLVNVKTEVIMAAVKLGYRSLLVDGDIVFLQNPLPLLNGPYDIHIQDDDKGGRNSGFMMCKASPWSLAFLARSLSIALQARNMRQQPAVNKALKEMKNKPLKVKVLGSDTFPCGMMYFEKPVRRMFWDEHPCTKCVLMHNNWIVGTNAKVYRFKEHLQWFVDTNEYYTSPTARYLQVDLPDKQATLAQEKTALVTAFKIAAVTNRILILPEFHCHRCRVNGAGGGQGGCSGNPGDKDRCNYLAHFKVRELDASGLQYRESAFRHHPWVPEGVKARREQLDFIASAAEATPKHNARVEVSLLHPENPSAGPTVAELRSWFGDRPVVHLHSVYNVRVQMAPSEAAKLAKKTDKATKKGDYRQY